MDGFEISGGRLVIDHDLDGELSQFKAACDALLESDESELVLDMTAAETFFSPYIGTIVALDVTAKERGKHVKVLISPALERIFDMGRLPEMLDVEVVE